MCLILQHSQTNLIRTTHSNPQHKNRSASLYASLLPLGSVFLGPYFGHRVDVELGKPDRGWHGWWRRGGGQPQGNGSNSSGSRWSCVAQWLALPGSVQLWAMLVTVLGLALVAAAPGAWVVGFVAMGLGFAMGSSSLWAMVPVFVQCKSLGLAFGVVHALMDIGASRELGDGIETGVSSSVQCEADSIPSSHTRRA